MIEKEDLKKHLSGLLKEVAPGDMQAILADGQHVDIKKHIESLEKQPSYSNENIRACEEIFQKRLQNIADLVFDVTQNPLSGPANFGQLSLLNMCVNELLVTLHLLKHRYANQAYSHIRTVFEHLDRVELFRVKPEWADVWAGDDQKKILKELSPSAVRKKLGEERYDPIYGFFSSLGPHGTFQAVQVSAAREVKESNPKDISIRFCIGGTQFEHNIVWLNSFALYALYGVLLQLMRSFEKRLNEEECKEMLNEAFEEFILYMKEHLISWAQKRNLNTKALEEFLDGKESLK